MSRKFSIGVHAHGDDHHDASPRISAVVQVCDEGSLQLLELTVSAVDGGPISPNIARNIDFALLTAGLNSIVAATLPPAEGGVAVTAAAPVVVTPAPEPVEADDVTAAPPLALKERPYRRMPDVEEVKAVMERTQSVGKVARHFDVPRYTAQAWIDRLRRTGQFDSERPQADD
jgi:hypothetical protein